MDPNFSSWDRIQTLFEAALQLADEDRSEFLDRSCQGDDQLRGEVESLLASYAPGAAELEDSPVRLPSSASDSGNDVPTDAIPGYKILKELHRGGQGVVYQAVQQSTKRKVALKLMLEGPFAGPASKRRFEREVELVGSLSHPGIVPIFDSGVTHGQYFYAMEYIRGKPMDKYVRDNELSVNQTLSLFIKVCIAIDYAHQKGVIHRDLKPTNILVDESGEPHVLDFGLAKVGGADFDDAGQALLVSVTGQIMGTLAYMSPEQAAGQTDQVDMRSDVYALGVLLYELLSGQLPYDLDSSMADNLSTIVKSEPRRLTTVRGGRINDEAGTIILKALSKGKSRRYPTAGALGEDLDRFLQGRPIEAKRDSALYVLRKTLRRNLTTTIVATSFLLLVLSSSIVSWWLYLSATRAKKAESVAAAKFRNERDNAQRSRNEVHRLLETSQRNYYLSEMNLAGRALSDPGGIARVDELTTKWVPQAGDIDLRGWEWYYLRSLLNDEISSLAGHTHRIWSISWHPDGRLLASAGTDGTLKVWDTVTCDEVHWPLHDQRVHSGKLRRVQWSPDGLRLASAGADHLVNLWSREGAPSPVRLEHPCPVRDVSWSPDGARIASAGDDGKVRLWDANSGDAIGAPMLVDGDSTCLQWSPNQSYLAIGGRDGTIRIWDVTVAKEIRQLRRHKGQVFTLCWNPNGSQIATACDDDTSCIWDFDTGALIHELTDHERDVTSVDWSRDGKWLATASRDTTIIVWNAENGHLSRTFRGHNDEALCVRWSPSGSQLASAGWDQTVRIWDASEKQKPVMMLGHEAVVSVARWNWDGTKLATGSWDGDVKIWDTKTAREVSFGFIPISDRVADIQWSPKGEQIAVAVGSVALVCDAESGKQISLDGHQASVRGLAWSPDGHTLATTSRDGTVILWDQNNWKQMRTLELGEPSECVAWSPDGRLLAVGDREVIRLWETKGWSRVDTIQDSHEGNVASLDFSPNGLYLASTGYDTMINVWSVKNREQTLSISTQRPRIYCVRWSPDSTRLATANRDGSVRLWDAIEGREVLMIKAHNNRVMTVDWSPDGTRLASAGHDASVKIWDASSAFRDAGE